MRDKREFARIPVHISAGVQPLDEDQAGRVRDEILVGPSVWSPSNESALRDMVSRSTGSNESFLAQAVLELADQVACLRFRVLEQSEQMVHVDLVQLSGGGGQLATELPLKTDDLLLLRLEDEDDGTPPIRTLIRVVHRHSETRTFGFRFDAIHPKDQERMIRLIYRFQREALRQSR